MLGTPTVKIDNNQHIEQACSTNRNISIDEWNIEENFKYVHKYEYMMKSWKACRNESEKRKCNKLHLIRCTSEQMKHFEVALVTGRMQVALKEISNQPTIS